MLPTFSFASESYIDAFGNMRAGWDGVRLLLLKYVRDDEGDLYGSMPTPYSTGLGALDLRRYCTHTRIALRRHGSPKPDYCKDWETFSAKSRP